jgi:hypothetical protein
VQRVNVATRQHADNFSKVWTYGKVAIFLDDVHKQFATDFANMIIPSFIESQQRAAAAAAKPKVISTEE